MIDVRNVSKDFKVFKRPDGFWGSVKSMFHREYSIKNAVRDVSFKIDSGEIVGYVGPNGAGKSTTIKMLSGILNPTRGEIVVDNIVPYKNRRENAKKIGVVFGQRSQLYWDLPVRDSFTLHKEMYDISHNVYTKNVSLFTELLQMSDFIDQPVRQLSLGQKMRANIAISLLHNPKLVYLDEPTVGLDIVAKAAIREFIQQINMEKGTTFIITTHDMNDIEQTCQRLILIDKGELRYDGALDKFKNEYGNKYMISFSLRSDVKVEHPLLDITCGSTGQIILNGDKSIVPIADAVNFLTHNYEVVDIEIRDSNIESILKEMYIR